MIGLHIHVVIFPSRKAILQLYNALGSTQPPAGQHRPTVMEIDNTTVHAAQPQRLYAAQMHFSNSTCPSVARKSNPSARDCEDRVVVEPGVDPQDS